MIGAVACKLCLFFTRFCEIRDIKFIAWEAVKNLDNFYRYFCIENV